MANAVYFTLFALSVLNIVFLSVVVKRQRCFYYVTFFALISISCFGYVTMANAANAEVALMGNILTYFGACFLPYCFLLCMSELCQIPIKKWISLIMLAYNIIVFCLDIFMLAVLALFRQWYIVLFIFILQLFVGSAAGIIRMSFAGSYAKPEEQAVFLNRISTCLDMGSATGPFLGYTIYAATGNFTGIALVIIPFILLAIFTLKKIKGAESV